MRNDFVNSLTINSYQFSTKGSDEYVLNQYMKNSWPVVYIIKNDKINEAELKLYNNLDYLERKTNR